MPRNVYTTSDSTNLRKITANGSSVWSVTTFNSATDGLCVDIVGNVWCGGYDNEFRKFDANGNQLWVFYNVDTVHCLCVDNQGNAYSGDRNAWVKKVDPNGNEIWVNTSASDYVFGVAVDTNYNVYSGTRGNFVRKIDSAGGLVWSYNNGTNVYDLALDTSGNVYFTGLDGTKKLDNDGNLVWSSVLHDGLSLAADNFYHYTGGLDNNLKKCNNADGSEVWNYAIGEYVDGVSVDPEGYVYEGDRGNKLRKIDSGGILVWTKGTFTQKIRTVKSDPGAISAGFWVPFVSQVTFRFRNDDGGLGT